MEESPSPEARENRDLVADPADPHPSEDSGPSEELIPDPEELKRRFQDSLSRIVSSQEHYDKTTFTLSGGALGLSFAFLKDVVGGDPIVYSACLLLAWSSWTVSLIGVLASYWFSIRTHEHHAKEAVKCLEGDQDACHRYYSEDTPTSPHGRITIFCNTAAGVCFVLGVAFMVVFVGLNLGRTDIAPGTKETSNQVATEPGTPRLRMGEPASRPPEEGFIPSSTTPTTAPKKEEVRITDAPTQEASRGEEPSERTSQPPPRSKTPGSN